MESTHLFDRGKLAGIMWESPEIESILNRKLIREDFLILQLVTFNLKLNHGTKGTLDSEHNLMTSQYLIGSPFRIA